MNIEILPIEDIKEYEKNVKQHPADQIAKIAKSIKEFGFNIPILVDKENTIIAGHGRLLAAKSLEMKKIPVIRMEHLTEDQVRAFRIADNKVAESPWEMDFLKDELIALRDSDIDLFSTGFTEEEIQEIVVQNEINKIEDAPSERKVITVEPPDAPPLKERASFYCKTKEEYDAILAYFNNQSGRLDTAKLSGMLK
jgi:ParB-like chromosome segregation protein Spo0J